ncbi:uncharacterized protein [Nicotiana sylvestris]|uniref:uncharacterized protein n=1 Tax=Nicotiana sylvestris TaxID=4096 RepID=UPI00388CED01
MPDIPKYDGTTDPRDHVTTFTTGAKGNDLTKQEIESVLVKQFGEMFTKGALTWYSLLPENSINSFAKLADSFIKAHSGAQKVEKRMEDNFKIEQGDSELLREFVDRFQRERMTFPRVPDNWAAIAFTSNLNEKSLEATRRLKESLREFPATTWNDVYNRYSTKLRIEEDTVPRFQKEEKVSSRHAETEKRFGKNKYEPYMGPAGKDSRSKQDNQRYDHRSRNRESGSSSRFRNERNNYESRDDDENLKAKFGGYNFNVSTSELVAVLRSMGDKMQVEDKVIPKAHTLSGFDNSSVLTKGEVTLTTFVEGVVKDTKFQVVDMEMAYNMILGRLWIHEMDVVPSTLHQVIKFLSPYGICQIRGDQHTVRAINSVADTSTRDEGK